MKLLLLFILLASPLCANIAMDGSGVSDIASKSTLDMGSVLGGMMFVGTPTSELRAIEGSTSTVTEYDRTYTRAIGTSQVTDFRWSWTVSPSMGVTGAIVTRGTSNASVIVPNPNDPELWSFVGAGTANITLDTGATLRTRTITTSTSGGGTTDTLVGYSEGSLRKHITDTIDGELAGKSPTIALKIFSTRNTTTHSYARNINLWTSCDLTGATASGWGGYAIAPDTVIYAAHAHQGVGSTVDFVGPDNTAYTRTITAGAYASGYTPFWPDWWIAKLDSPLPAAIKPAKFLPVNYNGYLPAEGLTVRFPSIGMNQFREASVQDVLFISTTGTSPLTRTATPQNPNRLLFYKTKIGGDSSSDLLIPINGEAVMLAPLSTGGSGVGTSMTSQRVAIDAAMVTLGSAYQTTTVSVSSFTNYPTDPGDGPSH